MNKVLKEFKLSTWSIYNKMTVFVLIGMIFIAGIFSYQSMPREAFPEIVHEIKIKDLFPEGLRMIAGYLQELMENSLGERILSMTDPKDLSARTGKPLKDFYKNGKFNPFSVIDILISDPFK